MKICYIINNDETSNERDNRVSKRTFIKNHGARICPRCRSRTSLFEMAQFNDPDAACDVCTEAGETWNSIMDNSLDEEHGRKGFMQYAADKWPTMTRKRLAKCWESNAR